MSSGGIVRRVDELGRIVIPKEIRKIFRLYEGSTLEISVNKNNEIVLTKYSKIHNLSEYASVMCDAIYNALECGVFICDMENIIASNKKANVNKSLNENVINIFKNRKSCILQKKESMMMSLYIGDTYIYTSQGIVPIISEGDVVGGVIIYTTSDTELLINDLKICQVVASILGEL